MRSLKNATMNYKYIIMCGGTYTNWEKPRQLIEYEDEPIVARTIRLLRENGIKDIAISTHNDVFAQFGLPLLKHTNEYTSEEYNVGQGQWVNAFYPMDEPTCYIFGDVIFSPQAIRTIVADETRSVMLYGSKKPFSPYYPKKYVEPFAFKVYDTELFFDAIDEVKRLDAQGVFKRRPIAWELWSVINGTDPNKPNRKYVAINDYTCDIDYPEQIDEVLKND